MTQPFWYQPPFTTSSESDCDIPETNVSFSNDVGNLDVNYEDSADSRIRSSASERMQLQSTSNLMQAAQQQQQQQQQRTLRPDLERQVGVIAHTPSESIFHSSNSGTTLHTSASSQGIPSPGSISSLSPYSLIQNPLSYTSHNDASYHLTHPASAHQNYSTTTNCTHNFPQTFDFRGRIGPSIPNNSGMPPPLRNLMFPTSPSNLSGPLRNDYGSASFHNRTLQPSVNPFQLTASPSPPLSSASRGAGSAADRESPSSSTYGYGSSSMHHDVPTVSASGRDVPPFEATKCFYQMIDELGRSVVPDIHAKIDKGFFRADSDWCCYRRNYFSVACSYKLTSTSGEVDHERVNLVRDGRRDVIYGFYVSIAARINGEDDRVIELVQHTAKRDKGPMTPPERKLLKPNSTGNLHPYAGASTFGSPHGMGNDYVDPYQIIGAPPDNPSIANFDRIQFKKATANNGKRRAAQQYFHIVVQLFAKIRKQNGEEDFVKVAHRESEQMVVRGRSPGHYADGTRTSSNMGGGAGAGGSFGPMSRDVGSTLGMGGHNSMSGSNWSTRSGDHSNYQSQTHEAPGSYNSYSSASSSYPLFVHAFTEPESHLSHHRGLPNNHYYRNVTYENHDYSSRPTTTPASLGSTGSSPSPYDTPVSYLTMSPIKEENFPKQSPRLGDKPRGTGLHSLQLPVLGAWGSSHDTFQPPRECRPWHTEPQQRTYHPTMSAL